PETDKTICTRLLLDLLLIKDIQFERDAIFNIISHRKHSSLDTLYSFRRSRHCSTKMIETPSWKMHINKQSTRYVVTCQTMASVQISYDPAPECQTMILEHVSLSPGRKCQENVSHGDKTGSTSNELDLMFSSMFDDLLNGSSKVVSKSSAVSAADAPNQRQQLTTPLNNHTTPAPTC
nr:hypothetical protein [Tanacetum cinerariifolium]